eukprot:751856-Hanusia_phi.AAC.5
MARGVKRANGGEVGARKKRRGGGEDGGEFQLADALHNGLEDELSSAVVSSDETEHARESMKEPGTSRVRPRRGDEGTGRARTEEISVQTEKRDRETRVSCIPPKVLEGDSRRYSSVSPRERALFSSSPRGSDRRKIPQGSRGYVRYVLGEISPVLVEGDLQEATPDMFFPKVNDDWTPQCPPFMKVPFKLEKTLSIGFLVCADSFLFNFTLLPLRTVSAVITYICSLVPFLQCSRPVAILEDVSRAGLMFSSLAVLLTVDISFLYHYIRGQMSSYIKLYVIYNVLEVC